MRAPNMSTVWLLWRVFIALVLVKFAIDAVWASTSKSYMGAFGILLVAAALFVTAAIVVSPDLAGLAARPFTSFIDSIYLPGGSEKKPPLDYNLARLYERRGQLELAEVEYARILRYYPRELDAYFGLAEIYLKLKDGKAAEKVLDKAARRFRKDAELEGVIGKERERILAEFEEDAVEAP